MPPLRFRAFADLADPAIRRRAALAHQRRAQRPAAHRLHGRIQHVGAARRFAQLARERRGPAARRAGHRPALRRRRGARPLPPAREAAPSPATLSAMTAALRFAGEQVAPAELERRAACAAAGLERAGVGDGDVVALMLHNSPAYLEAMLACRRLGAYYCPINWHYRADEAGHILRDSGAKVLVVDPTLLEQIRPAVPQSLSVVTT